MKNLLLLACISLLALGCSDNHKTDNHKTDNHKASDKNKELDKYINMDIATLDKELEALNKEKKAADVIYRTKRKEVLEKYGEHPEIKRLLAERVEVRKKEKAAKQAGNKEIQYKHKKERHGIENEMNKILYPAEPEYKKVRKAYYSKVAKGKIMLKAKKSKLEETGQKEETK